MTPPEIYVRESDRKRFKIEYAIEHMPLEYCKLIPLDDNPMPEILPGMGVKAQGYEIYTVAKVIDDKVMCHHAGRGLLEICKKEAITEILDNEGRLIWEARK